MFDREMVKKKFHVEKVLDLENFWSKTTVGLRKLLVQDKVGLGKFSPYFIFSIKP